MTLRSSSTLVLSVLALVTAACSAAVSPDITRLGDGGPGSDGGGPRMDGATVDLGPGHDGGPGVDLGPGHDGGPGMDGGPVDAGPTCPPTCEDGIACTVDGCDVATGTCHHIPTDSLCAAGNRCAATGCVPIGCTSDASCSDGDPCNGMETCAASGMCVAGTPLSCNDAFACTADSCVTGTGCVHAPNDAACVDAVGCTADTCSPATGCVHTPNDALCAAVCVMGSVCNVGSGCTTGTPVMCVPDGDPCTADPTMCDPTITSGCAHPPRDQDGDGYPAATEINIMGIVVACPGGTDCNDSNPAVHPGATEVCNGIDDNCNGLIDEGGVCGTPGPDTCATEAAITLGPGTIPGTQVGAVSGNNGGDADDYRASCGGVGGRDAVYYVDLTSSGTPGGAVDVTVSTNNPGTDFDTLLAAQVGGTCGTFNRACNDDISGTNHTSSITFCVMLGAPAPRVHILMDGYDGSATSIGNYDLTVTVAPHPVGVPCGP